MEKPILVIKKSPRDYNGLAALGNTVIAALTGNANFVSPSPALVNLQAAVTDVTNAIAVWGPVGNRGSHASLVDLRSKSLTLANLLKAEAEYCMNTAEIAAGNDYVTMSAILTTSGFDQKNPKIPQGVLEQVQGLHNFISRQLNPNQVRLNWVKPLNVRSAGNVKSYNIYRGTNAVFADAQRIATTTKASFIDTNESGTVQTWYYFIAPVNASGEGVVADPIVVTVVG